MESSSNKDAFYEACKAHRFIIGADETGLGAWAGPLCVCAVALPSQGWKPPPGLNDSKKVSPAKRYELASQLKYDVVHKIFEVPSSEVDARGIASCVKELFTLAVKAVHAECPDNVIVLDGEVALEGIDHYHFPKADGEVHAVMAASILAKVHRDRIMVKYAEEYQGYGFAKHAGYGTSAHHAAIKKLGMTPIHRRSFVPNSDEIETSSEHMKRLTVAFRKAPSVSESEDDFEVDLFI